MLSTQQQQHRCRHHYHHPPPPTTRSTAIGHRNAAPMFVSASRIGGGASRSALLGLSRSLGLSSRSRPLSRTPGPACRGSPCVGTSGARGSVYGFWGGAAAPGRLYGRTPGHRDDDDEDGKEETVGPAKKADKKKRMMFMAIPSPGAWLKHKFLFFLVRTYFDSDFNIEEFTEGAKQAFSSVSSLVAESKFDQLQGLMDEDALEELRHKCSLMGESQRRQLAVPLEDVMYSATDDVAIYYDNSGRRYVNILMRFWYLTSASLPDSDFAGMKIITFSAEDEDNTQRIATASYEFRREFTEGVDADWTVIRLVHWKMME
ncbi:unnamed protein product [Lampetra fluviatilis]